MSMHRVKQIRGQWNITSSASQRTASSTSPFERNLRAPIRTAIMPRLFEYPQCVTIAWAAKSIILRIGGIQLYNRCRPFFVGILAGYAMAVLLSFVVDSIWFPEDGHHMHSW